MAGGITVAQVNSILKWVQIGESVVPIVVSTVGQLREIFASQGYDTAVFDQIDTICADRIVLSDAEAAAHGHPRPPGNG